MAPGPCTCGGWYKSRTCTNPSCPWPEGPVGRALRLESAASDARAVVARAIAAGTPNAPQFVAWSSCLDTMARDARAEALEAQRAAARSQLPRIRPRPGGWRPPPPPPVLIRQGVAGQVCLAASRPPQPPPCGGGSAPPVPVRGGAFPPEARAATRIDQV
eukprot:4848601-Alexandrium_andersonii.AAC.1